jgi:hypothetical protein
MNGGRHQEDDAHWYRSRKYSNGRWFLQNTLVVNQLDARRGKTGCFR